MDVNRKSLIGRLNETCTSALEGAAGLCLKRTNYDVEVEHFLTKLIEPQGTDMARILRYYEIDSAQLAADLTQALEKLKTGNASTPAMSPRLPRWLQATWMLASIDYGAQKIRSGHLLLALLVNDDLARLARELSKQFKRISVETLRENLIAICAGSTEDKSAAAALGGPSAESASGAMGKTKALDQFTIDLTAKARKGDID